jgi:asparagine synthase (glutamine-hydrolysing)
MSGIVGVWNVDGRPIDRSVVSRMTVTLRHRAVDGEGVHVDGPVALAHQHLPVTAEETREQQPLVSARGVWLAMDGRIDNRDELLPALTLPSATSDAACVLAAYERWGEAFAERLCGEFAIAIADVPRRTMLLARDPIGVRPLYFAHTPRLFAFASEIKALLAHPDIPTRPDDEGVADYLLIDTRPLDRQHITCFAGISGVVASHVVVVTRERLTTRRYWDFDPGRAIRLRSFEEYAEAFRERFAEAVRRRARGPRPIAVSVSGGLDSSSIFCQADALRRCGRIDAASLVGVSYTGAAGGDADEREYLEVIERELSATIDRFPMEPLVGFVRGAEDQIRAVEAPFVDYMWGITREVQRRAASQGARVLLSGHWGDQVLFSSAYLADLFVRGSWRRIRQHTREYARWFGDGEAGILTRRVALDLARRNLPRPLLPPLKWLKRRLLRAHRQKQWFSERFLSQALRDADRPVTLGLEFHSAHAESIYLEARSKYHVKCLEWNNKIGALHGLEYLFPFLDRDLLAFLMAVPGEVQNRDGVPRALIREAMRGVLPDALRARRWKADFTGVVNQGVAQDASTIVRALGPESQSVRWGFIDSARLQPELDQLLPRLSGPDSTASWDLSDLYGLEIWLQVFLSHV